MSKCLLPGLLSQIKERTLTKIILAVNFVITPLCITSYVQEKMSERELNSLLYYKFCMSEMATWKPYAPPPVCRQLAQALVLFSLITKWVIYFKMWSKTKRVVQDTFRERCKELSDLLFGQLMYTTAEILPIASISIYVICVAIFNISNPDANKIFLLLTVPSINFLLLPTIQIFVTPAIRADLKKTLINLIRSGCKISHPPNPKAEITLRPMNGNPENPPGRS